MSKAYNELKRNVDLLVRKLEDARKDNLSLQAKCAEFHSQIEAMKAAPPVEDLDVINQIITEALAKKRD